METRSMRISLAIWSVLVITFLWIPLVIIGLYAFNRSNIGSGGSIRTRRSGGTRPVTRKRSGTRSSPCFARWE